MALATVGQSGGTRPGERLLACVQAQGSAAHPYLADDALLRGPHAARNLSDAVHFICTLHGRYPGVIDHAANRCAEPETRHWFTLALDGFAAERAFIARLAVAAGPIPSTPGAGDNEAAVMGQRHAIEMLAQSERRGCALGAALALAVDWGSVREVLDVAAARFGIDAPAYQLGERTGIRDLVNEAASAASVERAMLFGAEQIVLQHFGLWDLLEARQQARGDL
jgi:hypothetical protein